ncbi:MAG: hypothetical protein KKG60_01225 [Nanoarchaeota archaeon]|nr:hypothetical protein [Nanoarchaeota archaeon]
MGNFRSDNRGGSRNRDGGSRFGGRSKGRGGFRDSDSRRSEREPSEMHDAICAKCGSPCQLPFKPKTDKPVFCSDCFKQNEGSRSSRSGMSSEQFNQINEKLDQIMKALKIEE